MKRNERLRTWGGVFLLTSICAAAEPGRVRALTPPEALTKFRLESGLRIELVASEPLVIDPVAIAFDEDRRMYVVEDRGYPDPIEGEPTTEGRIALLEDVNGDGRYDRRSEFAAGLTYPNGILPWRGGVFVTCAPDVFYLKDLDGDGVADERRVVLTGFNATKTAQIRMSHPTLGLDGWIYLTSGLNGGEVRSPEHPERPVVSFSPSDSRFHPDTLEFETTGGRGQFGLTFDPYGRRFVCSNRHPVQHVVLEPRDLRRNPYLSFTDTVQNVSPVESEATVYPISGAITSADFIPKLMGRSHAGTFTSASGLILFYGTGLTPAHRGNAFICESAQNLVQRQIVFADGVSFRSERAYEGREFLASSDEWFRPVFLDHGPDGGLYMADMHRKVIDHPQYVPEEVRPQLDFASGRSDGRIYRIVREEFQNALDADRHGLSSRSSTLDLVRALESAEEWERRTAQRLLLERDDRAAVAPLARCAVESRFPESQARALWTLRSLGVLDATTVQEAFADAEAGVREQAVLLAEALCAQHPEMTAVVAGAARDDDMRVRFASALVLGSLEGPEVLRALAHLAATDGADRWMRAAVLSGIGSRLGKFLAAFRDQPEADPVAFAAVMQDLGRLFGTGASMVESRMLFKEVISGEGDHAWRIPAAVGLAEGASGRSDLKLSRQQLLRALLGEDHSESAREDLERFLAEARRRTGDRDAPRQLRLAATALLGYTTFEQAGPVLAQLLDARHPPELQLEAVAALARLSDARAGELLTEKRAWSNYTPQVRAAVISALVSKPDFTESLFTAIEQGVISAAEISSTARQRLMKDEDPAISGRAEALFQELEGGDRMQVYQDYRPVLDRPADAAAGEAAFLRACSACHVYDGVGGKVGPDLTGVRNQPADALLLHIIVPNYEVLPAYQTVSVETRDGRDLSGWMMAETENSLTLRTAYGTEESILRSHIASLTSSGASLMPDGLEQTMTRQEMADLIAYLKDMQ